MALDIPTYPNPFDPNTPLTNVYAWMSGIGMDMSNNTGRLTLNIHPNEAAWVGTPIGQISIALGETLVPANPTAEPPVEEVKFPTFTELMAIPEFATAYTTIGGILYQNCLPHPMLAGATPHQNEEGGGGAPA
jgi:hypothetical protein